MKRFLVTLFVVSVSACTALLFVDSTNAQKPGELEALLDKSKSATASKRVVAFDGLAKYWDRSPYASAGFSDTPPKSTPKNARPVIEDRDLDAIASAILRGIADKDADVREAAAKGGCPVGC